MAVSQPDVVEIDPNFEFDAPRFVDFRKIGTVEDNDADSWFDCLHPETFAPTGIPTSHISIPEPIENESKKMETPSKETTKNQEEKEDSGNSLAENVAKPAAASPTKFCSVFDSPKVTLKRKDHPPLTPVPVLETTGDFVMDVKESSAASSNELDSAELPKPHSFKGLFAQAAPSSRSSSIGRILPKSARNSARWKARRVSVKSKVECGRVRKSVGRKSCGEKQKRQQSKSSDMIENNPNTTNVKNTSRKNKLPWNTSTKRNVSRKSKNKSALPPTSKPAVSRPFKLFARKPARLPVKGRKSTSALNVNRQRSRSLTRRTVFGRRKSAPILKSPKKSEPRKQKSDAVPMDDVVPDRSSEKIVPSPDTSAAPATLSDSVKLSGGSNHSSENVSEVPEDSSSSSKLDHSMNEPSSNISHKSRSQEHAESIAAAGGRKNPTNSMRIQSRPSVVKNPGSGPLSVDNSLPSSKSSVPAKRRIVRVKSRLTQSTASSLARRRALEKKKSTTRSVSLKRPRSSRSLSSSAHRGPSLHSRKRARSEVSVESSEARELREIARVRRERARKQKARASFFQRAKSSAGKVSSAVMKSEARDAKKQKILTIPHPFRFVTGSRSRPAPNGEQSARRKNKSPASFERSLRVAASPATRKISNVRIRRPLASPKARLTRPFSPYFQPLRRTRARVPPKSNIGFSISRMDQEYNFQNSIRGRENEGDSSNVRSQSSNTEPEAPKLHTASRIRETHYLSTAEREALELAQRKHFKALPYNKRLFTAPKPLGVPKAVKIPATSVEPFALTKSQRVQHIQPEKSTDADESGNGNEQSHGKVSSSPRKLTQVTPFKLRTNVRGEIHETRFNEQIQRDKQEAENLTNFHARGIPDSEPFVVEGSSKLPTTFEEFTMPGKEIHERNRKELEIAKITIENREKALCSSFKALVMPLHRTDDQVGPGDSQTC
eukprot:168381_1